MLSVEVDSEAQGGDAGLCQLGPQGIRKANNMDAEISQDEAGIGAKRKTVVRGQLRGSWSSIFLPPQSSQP